MVKGIEAIRVISEPVLKGCYSESVTIRDSEKEKARVPRESGLVLWRVLCRAYPCEPASILPICRFRDRPVH